MRASIFLLSWVLHAQPAPPPATFEVVSIKPSRPDAVGMFFRPQPGGGLRTTNITVKMLLFYAYGVREFQISGGPAWIDSARYDITAKAEPSPGSDSPPGDQTGKRVQAMLTDRFHLAFHRETKEAPVYALVVARSGPRLKEDREGEVQRIRVSPATTRQGQAQIDVQASPVRALTGALANTLGRPVLDKTGLPGKYDLHLEWTPEPARAAADPSLPDGPSIFTALHEQLGLRLDSQRAPVEMLIIDHVEKPSEN